MLFMSNIAEGFGKLYGDKAGERTRAFIVDDEPAMSRSAGRILRSSDAGIAATADFLNPSKAIAELTSDGVRDSVALIVSDFNMPVGTGIDLARHLRSTLGETKIPFLLMSGGVTETTRKAIAEAMWIGNVDAFLEKPFESDALLAAVEAAIEKRIQVLREDDAE